MLSKEEKDSYRRVIGQIGWDANQTRPDISYDACQMSIAYKNATVEDILKTNKTIKKMKRDKIAITFPSLSAIEKSMIIVHSDASFNNLPNGRSQGGFILFLCDQEGHAAPIHWQSKKIRRVVKSTLAAECLALQEAGQCILPQNNSTGDIEC